MIYKGDFKAEAFLRTISLHISPAEKPTEKFADKGYTYLGAGYWRCRPVRNTDGKIIGLKLLNPDYTNEDIYRVEQGIATLLHLEFSGDVGIGEWEQDQIAQEGSDAQDG